MNDDFFQRINFERTELKTGVTLISEPFLADPNFSRTVILLAEHNVEDGSIGFVMNRKSDLTLEDIVDDFPPFDGELFLGGPVGHNQLFFLHTQGELIHNTKEIIPGLYWGGDFDQVCSLIEAGILNSKNIRFFIGYSGWATGQLEEEIKERAWIVSRAPSELLMIDNEEYWKEIMVSLGKEFKIMANFPQDPSLN